jgi:hypothetical protein
LGKLSTANWPADEPATVIKVRAPEAEEIQRDAGGRRFVSRLDAEAGGYFRWFLDRDDRWKVDELTGELVLRGDDDGGDDDPTPAAKPADERSRIRESKANESRGPPRPKMAKAPFQRRGSQAGFTNADVCCTRCTRQIPPHREFLKPEIFRNGDSRPELEAVESAEIGFEHQVERLIALAGARGMAELLAELGRERMLRQVIETKVALYVGCLEALGRETLAALGADRLPNPPIHEIKASGGKSDG